MAGLELLVDLIFMFVSLLLFTQIRLQLIVVISLVYAAETARLWFSDCREERQVTAVLSPSYESVLPEQVHMAPLSRVIRSNFSN